MFTRSQREIGKGKLLRFGIICFCFQGSGVRKGKGRTRHDRYTTAAHRICKSQGPGSSPDHGAGVRVAWCHRPRESLSASFVMVAQPQRERENIGGSVWTAAWFGSHRPHSFSPLHLLGPDATGHAATSPFAPPTHAAAPRWRCGRLDSDLRGPPRRSRSGRRAR